MTQDMICRHCNAPADSQAGKCEQCGQPLFENGPEPVEQAPASYLPPLPVSPDQGSPNAPAVESPTPYQSPASTLEGDPDWMPYDSDKASSQAILALVLGVFSLCCCGCLTGIPALALGFFEYQNIQKERSSPKGLWMVWVAMILGALSTLSMIAGIIIQFGAAIMNGF